jgi:hypothetical protein
MRLTFVPWGGVASWSREYGRQIGSVAHLTRNRSLLRSLDDPCASRPLGRRRQFDDGDAVLALSKIEVTSRLKS